MKIRLDRLLVEKGFTPSRQKAQALIGAGLVRVNDQKIDKAGTQVEADAVIEVAGPDHPYVSRGGVKLAAALDFFQLDPSGLVCADIGASTGGFTDCLLQRGAKKIFAIDVGYGQLAWKLRQDERVVVMERTNARHLKAGDLDEPIDLAVIDASFISLKLLLPPILALFKTSPAIVALIKPQFEVGRDRIGKGGVVRETELHEAVVAEIRDFAASLRLACCGVIPSPILGPKGNREFLIYLSGSI